MIKFEDDGYCWLDNEQTIYLHRIVRMMEFYLKDTKNILGEEFKIQLIDNKRKLLHILQEGRYFKAEQEWLNSLHQYLE